jgi:hypothetical protein
MKKTVCYSNFIHRQYAKMTAIFVAKTKGDERKC